MPSTNCGNGHIDPGEACDDGNTTDFDGCSSACKSNCEKCLNEFYGEDPDYQALVDFCRNSMVVAADGPSVKQPRSKLCQRLARCIVTSGCYRESNISYDSCYCGGISNKDCESGKAVGACVREYEAAAETREPGTILVQLTNLTLGVGWATELTNIQANRGYCAAPCLEDRAVTDCERCSAGDTPVFYPPSSPPPDLCVGCLSGDCDAALIECVHANCADGNVQPCLGSAASADDTAKNGPCKMAVLALVDDAFQRTAADLRCKATQCKAECFKP